MALWVQSFLKVLGHILNKKIKCGCNYIVPNPSPLCSKTMSFWNDIVLIRIKDLLLWTKILVSSLRVHGGLLS